MMLLNDTKRENDTLPADEYRRIAKVARSAAGLMIPESKSAMVRSRLAKRMRVLGIERVSAYLDRVEGGDTDELREMVAVLTTNVTSFFREDHHFKLLASDIADGLLAKARAGGKVRIWSAGCSLGAEPVSIAITLLEHSTAFLTTDTRILATDIDQHVLASAKSGTYAQDMVRGISPEYMKRYFRPCDGQMVAVSNDVRKMISFRELNLIGAWPMRGRFDLIFCRNVAIYFDEETQSAIWSRFAECLVPGGWLFVGHSERVPDMIGLKTAGNTAYRKAADPRSAPEPTRDANVH